ncbi:MAG: 1,4-dihydroxy-2-naphthoate octaprenyltransferase [Candidatus Hydrogenedentota bacterium]
MNAAVWISAARPKTLPAAVAPVLIGTAIAYADSGSIHAISLLCALLGAILIQIGTNFANDYYDFVKGTDTAERIGPVRATQAGLVSPSAMRRAFLLLFALAMLPGAYIVYRGGWPFVVIGLVSIACGILYTGGPFPLGYLGLGDIFVLVFFGPVAVGGTYYLHTLRITPEHIGLTPFDVLIAGLAPGLISVALLTVNNLRDIEQDRAGRKRTLAVRFGRTFARVEYASCVFLAGVAVPIYFSFASDRSFFLLVPVCVLAAGHKPLRAVFTQIDGPILNDALAATGKLLLVFSVVFALGWIL